MIGGTGCTSISKTLIQKFNGEWLPKEPILPSQNQGFGLEQKHNTLQQLIDFKLINREEVNKYLKFANVRNPFDRYATAFARFYGPDIEIALSDPTSWIYKDESGALRDSNEVAKTKKHLQKMIKISREKGFDAWLSKELGLQARLKAKLKAYCRRGDKAPYSYDYRILDNLDDFIRFENLEQDFNRILQNVGITEWISLDNVNPTKGKKPYQEYYSQKSRALIEKLFQEELRRFNYTFEPS